MPVAIKAGFPLAATTQDKVSGTTTALTYDSMVAGDLYVVMGVLDNLTTLTPTMTISKPGGETNNWNINLHPSIQAGAAAGTRGFIAYILCSTSWGAGGQTITWSGAIAAKAMEEAVFTGATDTLRGSVVMNQNTASIPQHTLSGLTVGDLVLSMCDTEQPTAPTPQPALGAGSTRVTNATAGSTSTTNVALAGAWKLAAAASEGWTAAQATVDGGGVTLALQAVPGAPLVSVGTAMPTTWHTRNTVLDAASWSVIVSDSFSDADNTLLNNKPTQTGGGTWRNGPNYAQTDTSGSGALQVVGGKAVISVDIGANNFSLNHPASLALGRRVTFDYTIAAGTGFFDAFGGNTLGLRGTNGGTIMVNGAETAVTGVGLSGTFQAEWLADGTYTIRINGVVKATGVLPWNRIGGTYYNGFWSGPTVTWDNFVLETADAVGPSIPRGTTWAVTALPTISRSATWHVVSSLGISRLASWHTRAQVPTSTSGPAERMLDDSPPIATATGTLTLGVRFVANADGYITHVRYYHLAGDPPGTSHTVSIWDANTQAKIATTTFVPAGG